MFKKKKKVILPSWPGYCGVESLGSLWRKRTINLHKVNKLVPTQRKWLDKFQEYLTTTLAYLVKAKHYLHTGEVQKCRYTWIKAGWQYFRCSPNGLPGSPRLLLKCCFCSNNVGGKWRRLEKRCIDPGEKLSKQLLQMWLMFIKEISCATVNVKTGNGEPLSWTTPLLGSLSAART